MSKVKAFRTIVFKDLEQMIKEVDELIENSESFTIVDIKRFKDSYADIERAIADAITRGGYTFRSRIAYRALVNAVTITTGTAVAFAAPPIGLSILGVGMMGASAAGAHDIATLNPDYEIVRHLLTWNIEVICTKKEKKEDKVDLKDVKI